MVAGLRDAVWGWQPLDTAWFQRMKVNALAWKPQKLLTLEADRVREAVARACDDRRSWLIHPALSILRQTADDASIQCIAREASLAVWIAANCGENLGSICSPTFILATAEGPRRIEQGRYDLSTLVADVFSYHTPWAVDLDLTGATLGSALDDAWDSESPAPLESQQRTQGITNFFSVISLIQHALPDVATWVARVTKVVVPYRIEPARTGYRSSSPEDVPGFVRMDITCGSLRVFELLLHESAHRYFYHAEVNRPFVGTAFVASRFPSPLKREPRPLRSVLLAFHALAYMCAGFRDLAESEFISDREAFEREFDTLRDSMQRAGETCSDALSCMTPYGVDFFKRTHEVQRYAGSR